MSDGVELGKLGEFFGSIVIDVLGLVSYVVPGVAELIDIGIAPLTAYWIFEMLTDVEEPDKYVSGLFSLFGGAEELSVGLDVIPSATIAWVYKWYFR